METHHTFYSGMMAERHTVRWLASDAALLLLDAEHGLLVVGLSITAFATGHHKDDTGKHRDEDDAASNGSSEHWRVDFGVGRGAPIDGHRSHPWRIGGGTGSHCSARRGSCTTRGGSCATGNWSASSARR